MSRPPYIAHALAGKLDTCPACGCDRWNGGGEMDANDAKTIRYTYTCPQCDAEWAAVYVLAGVQFHEVSDRPELDRWPEYPVADDPRAKDPA